MNVSIQHATEDQAVSLRRLVRAARAADPPAPVGEAPPPGGIIVFAGAKGGVGVSTLTLRVAEALALSGRPAVAVDANLRQADLGTIAGLSAEQRPALPDVLTGRRRAEEALAECANGLWLLPGAWAPAAPLEAPAEAVERLLAELDALALAGRTVVVDAGAGLTPWSDPIWRRATQTALVTVPDKLAVLNAYATIKLARAEGAGAGVGLLINGAPDEEAARRVHTRVSDTCQRFLGHGAPWLGWAPRDEALAGGAQDGPAEAVARLADALLAPAAAMPCVPRG